MTTTLSDRARPLPLQDARIMVRRSVKRMLRYPSLTVMIIALPVVFLLMFVFVFGGTLGDGIAGPGAGRDAYANYLTPGILLMTMAGGAQGTAIAIAMDLTEGILARFRTMPVARTAVLTGHVIGSVLQTAVGLVVVIGVALAVGFRPTASPLEWLAAAGLLLLTTWALTWFSIALGLLAKSVETASNTPMFLMLLPFLGSGFVPVDSFPPVLREFALFQPFTPITETLRGLLTGTPIGWSGPAAVAWALVIGLGCYAWARRLFARERVR